jgi:hypothetical protein
MTWNKLEYGKWPKGKIALRIVSDNGYVRYEVGEIGVGILNNEIYFITEGDGFHSLNSIDSIFDTEPHYIKLDNLEMPS